MQVLMKMLVTGIAYTGVFSELDFRARFSPYFSFFLERENGPRC